MRSNVFAFTPEGSKLPIPLVPILKTLNPPDGENSSDFNLSNSIVDVDDLLTKMQPYTGVFTTFIIIIILGGIGNFLVVFTVVVSKNMTTVTNILILNLALSDLLFLGVCIPFAATDYIVLSWPYGETACKVVQYLIHLSAYSSITTLVLLSIDRYISVVRPFTSKKSVQ